MTSSEFRDHILKMVVHHYRGIVRLENMLDGKKFQKTYKNPRCPSAKALSEDRREAIRCLVESRKWLLSAYHKLPEVRQDKSLAGEVQAFRYAKELCLPKKRLRFMKNQRKLT